MKKVNANDAFLVFNDEAIKPLNDITFREMTKSLIECPATTLQTPVVAK